MSFTIYYAAVKAFVNMFSKFNSTWAWGNQFLWQYDKGDDIELRSAYEYMTTNGLINWFDTADSYGTGIIITSSWNM